MTLATDRARPPRVGLRQSKQHGPSGCTPRPSMHVPARGIERPPRAGTPRAQLTHLPDTEGSQDLTL